MPGTHVYGAGHLLDVVTHFLPEGSTPPEGAEAGQGLSRIESGAPASTHAALPDLADVKGHAAAKRALEIAAAGGHSLLMTGPPGSGKSMLAHRFAGLLPPMSTQEALESAAIASLAGRFRPEHWMQRPTAAPHHSASSVALVGGGSPPRPGEISLAHHGVLFLDEFPEFSRQALEASCAEASVQPRPKVRETRAALVEHFASEHFVHPSGRFAPPADELLDWIRAGVATDISGRGSQDDDGDAGDPGEEQEARVEEEADQDDPRDTDAEAEAREAKRGIWRGPFELPSDWRAANPREGD